MRPTHRESNLLYSVYQFRCRTYPKTYPHRNNQNNVLANIWIAYGPVKLTYKMKHHKPQLLFSKHTVFTPSHELSLHPSLSVLVNSAHLSWGCKHLQDTSLPYPATSSSSLTTLHCEFPSLQFSVEFCMTVDTFTYLAVSHPLLLNT